MKNTICRAHPMPTVSPRGYPYPAFTFIFRYPFKGCQVFVYPGYGITS
uniref:Uncharacterized protein n=1 Tax=Arundo donax TaxID=35708 RepID=A0A0A9F8L8_ARUDO